LINCEKSKDFFSFITTSTYGKSTPLKMQNFRIKGAGVGDSLVVSR
jgi:hypothetical protein